MARVRLIGMVEPADASAQKRFEDWYLGNHVEDVSHAPGITRATVHRLAKPFMKTEPPRYVTIYEFDTESVEDAAAALNEYLSRPGWPGRRPNDGSVKILSAGWYVVDRSFSQPPQVE